MTITTYREAEDFILSLPRFTDNNSLETTREFYEFIGKPGQESLLIHVAGTNGKGSVCAYMNSVLTEAGYSAAMFTSPHLVTLRERMRIGETLISEEEFCEILVGVQNLLIEFNHKRGGTEYCPVFSEYLFFLAMLYFAKKDADVIILETGLGGRLDATNVIDAPKVTVITEIGMDHVELLGNTLAEIAGEKAAIIKPGTTVVYSGNRQESAKVIEEKAAKERVLCKCVPKHVKLDYRFVEKKIAFSFFSRYYEYIPLKLNTRALYQVENATLALTALEETGLTLSKEAMQQGIARCRWEGRMEEILPGVFLDGAHNEDGIIAFLEAVPEDGCTGERWLLFSAAADKKYQAMADTLAESGLFAHIAAAPMQNARGVQKKQLQLMWEDRKVRIYDTVKEAIEDILSRRNKEDFVYAAGSLYLVGEIKRLKLCALADSGNGGNND